MNMIKGYYPERGELVIGTVKNVNPYSALISLEQYNKEGMVHISEVARKWIHDIRDFVKEGQKVVALVMRIDKTRGHIELSLKRVSRNQAEEKMQEYKRELKAEKMLALVAKELGITKEQAWKEIGVLMQEKFGEIFKGFVAARDDPDMLVKKGISEKYAKAVRAVAEKALEIKEITIKGFLELACTAPNGIEIIKSALKEADKKGIEIKYISAPKYMLSLKTKNAKLGEKMLEEAARSAIALIEKSNGEGSFKIE